MHRLLACFGCSWLLLPAFVVPASFPAVSFAAEQAEVEGEVTAEEVRKLIDQLGSTEYVVRRRAERQLIRLGFDAFDALKAAEEHDDIEVASRASYLARQINIDWVREEDPREVRAILQGYEDLADPQRQERLDRLAALAGDEGLPALCRLVRYEKSQLLSKRAAIKLLEPKKPDPDLWKRRAEPIQQNLGRSNRPAARWLRAQLLSLADPAAALEQWTQLIDEEQRTQATRPEESDTDLVLSLMRRRVDLLKQLDRREEAVTAMFKMLELEEGKPETLVELMDWLVEQQAWDLVDQVAERFSAAIEGSGLLLYTLAQARLLQGQEAQAAELAARALKLNPGDVQEHIQLAAALQERGLKRWAENEYRYVIGLEPAAARTSLYARLRLSEMLHDQRKEQAAGQVLKELSEAMEGDEQVRRVLISFGREPGAILSRMEYFFSQQAVLDGDRARQREHLERAIRHDPTDADVLIAMYRVPDADEAYRERVSGLIRKAVDSFRKQIEENPMESTAYNQLAWLVGNTEGDFDEAVELSHKSLELRPGSAGYLDTLAHCYSAKKDYASAVKYQQQAVNLDPHTEVLSRQLEVFQQALEKSRQEEREGEKAEEG